MNAQPQTITPTTPPAWAPGVGDDRADKLLCSAGASAAVVAGASSLPYDPLVGDGGDYTLRFFLVAEDATGNIATQPDLAGNGTFVDSGTAPTAQGGGNRYGWTTATNGDMQRDTEDDWTMGSMILRGRLLNGVLGGLGGKQTEFSNGYEGFVFYVTSTTMVLKYKTDGGGTFTATLSGQSFSDDVTHTFGVTFAGSETFDFYVDGVNVGSAAYSPSEGTGAPGMIFVSGSPDTECRDFFGYFFIEGTPDGQGALIAALATDSGTFDASAHANHHAWLAANVAD